jgi:hypothetical protein
LVQSVIDDCEKSIKELNNWPYSNFLGLISLIFSIKSRPE